MLRRLGAVGAATALAFAVSCSTAPQTRSGGSEPLVDQQATAGDVDFEYCSEIWGIHLGLPAGWEMTGGFNDQPSTAVAGYLQITGIPGHGDIDLEGVVAAETDHDLGLFGSEPSVTPIALAATAAALLVEPSSDAPRDSSGDRVAAIFIEYVEPILIGDLEYRFASVRFSVEQRDDVLPIRFDPCEVEGVLT